METVEAFGLEYGIIELDLAKAPDVKFRAHPFQGKRALNIKIPLTLFVKDAYQAILNLHENVVLVIVDVDRQRYCIEIQVMFDPKFGHNRQYGLVYSSLDKADGFAPGFLKRKLELLI